MEVFSAQNYVHILICLTSALWLYRSFIISVFWYCWVSSASATVCLTIEKIERFLKVDDLHVSVLHLKSNFSDMKKVCRSKLQ